MDNEHTFPDRDSRTCAPDILTTDPMEQNIQRCVRINQRLDCYAAMCDSDFTACLTGMDLAILFRDIRDHVTTVLESLDRIHAMKPSPPPPESAEK